MQSKIFDIIVIGSGSGGLSVGLFMAKAGFNTLMVAKSDHDIGGDCLNDGCVPSKAFIHAARLAQAAKEATAFGLQVSGKADLKKVKEYVRNQQDIIRKHENAAWLQEQGVTVALGTAHFTAANEISVNGKRYTGKKIVIATGSTPRKLAVPGIEQVTWYDNESIFEAEQLPNRLLVVGGGPIGVEIAQAMSRFGSQVTVVQQQNRILPHDDKAITNVLHQQLKNEGVRFCLNANVERFLSAIHTEVVLNNGTRETVYFDAVFVAIGRQLELGPLQLSNAGIEVKEGKIVRDDRLRTTNKNVLVCGDVAGDLMFSHAAEFHGRIILNNLFSPLKKKLDNRHLSWVTFTEPEVATFGYTEQQLKRKSIAYERLEESFADDDRAVVDNYRYGKTVWFISPKRFLKKQKLLGGTMVAPAAGELIQELILANSEGLSIDTIFNKIYPYPVAARINQKLMVEYKSRGLTGSIKKLLQYAYKIFS